MCRHISVAVHARRPAVTQAAQRRKPPVVPLGLATFPRNLRRQRTTYRVGRAVTACCCGQIWIGRARFAQESARVSPRILSRRADSNCRPAVYETVLGSFSESQRVHLLAFSCRTMPVSARADRASGVRTGVNAAPQERVEGARCRADHPDSLAMFTTSARAKGPERNRGASTPATPC